MLTNIVTTKYGRIGGVAADGCVIYRGMPYAVARRFKQAQEPPGWDGVLAADKFPPRGPQANLEDMELYGKEFYSLPEYATPYSEDCLYLNIWAPAEAKEGDKHPVILWIHGGAFNHGYGHEMEFDGARYAKRGVILVTINYRLGALGYLAHPWLSKENADGLKTNFGLSDQAMALKWVHENIHAFGGDSDNVTLAGQSAGCISVHLLACSPAKKYFSKAILQSGAGYDSPMLKEISLERAEKTGEEFIKFCGINSLRELMAAPAQMFVEKEMEFITSTGRGGLLFTPVVDGNILPLHPDMAADSGKMRDIPYIIGCTKDDIAGMDKGGQKLRQVLNKAGSQPVYMYRFERDLPGDTSGAFHSSELWYTFGTLGRSWRPMEESDYALSGKMVDMWAAFAKTGCPDIPSENWPAFNNESKYIKIFK